MTMDQCHSMQNSASSNPSAAISFSNHGEGPYYDLGHKGWVGWLVL